MQFSFFNYSHSRSDSVSNNIKVNTCQVATSSTGKKSRKVETEGGGIAGGFVFFRPCGILRRAARQSNAQPSFGFATLTRQHRVDLIESRVDILSDLGACQNDLSRHKDQKHDFGLDHTIDQTREELP